MHNPEKDYNGILPYRNPYFPSIYKGISIEMHIVNHCNLNCAGCNHFSPLAKPWYISIDDFEKQIITLTNNISVVKEFIILGGEPTLHPNLIEICEITRKYLPDATISILSNGIFFKYIENNLSNLIENNIQFRVCSYPGYTNYEKIKQLQNQGLKTSYFNTRHISHQPLIDKNGTQNKEQNFFYCSEYRLPCFTLRDYKLFICPFSAHRHLYEDKINLKLPLNKNKDYLEITEINNNLDLIQDFCFTPKDCCKYCKQTDNYWIWHPSYQDSVEYEIPLKELYFTNYNRYDNIVNNNFEYFIKCCSEENPYFIDTEYAQQETVNLIKRLGLGKIDIIIPYYNVDLFYINTLIESLEQQSIIEDCVIYFVEDGNNDSSKKIINRIRQSSLNYVLLKTETRKGPGEARNLGFKKSFNRYVMFFDADDYFISNTALEDLYIKIKDTFDVVAFMMFANNDEGNKMNFIVDRSYLFTKKIKFNNLFFGEDFCFTSSVLSNTNNIYQFNNKQNLFAVYIRDNPQSLSNTLTNYDPYHFNFLTSRFLAAQENISNKTLQSSIINGLDVIIDSNKNLIKENKFFQIFVKWIRFKIYPNNNIIMNNDEINYLKDFIIQHYLNNFFTDFAAKEILKYL